MKSSPCFFTSMFEEFEGVLDAKNEKFIDITQGNFCLVNNAWDFLGKKDLKIEVTHAICA
jgi:hypothetical protein